MKKNIYKLLKLYESFSDLFDDDILGDEETSGSMDSELSSKIALNDLKPVIIDLLGVDKPRAWKYSKDKDGNQILMHESKTSYGTDKYTDDVINTLKNKGFGEYRPSNNPYAFIHGLDYVKGMKARHPQYNFPSPGMPMYNNFKADIDRYNDWVSNIFPKMPYLVQDIFKSDLECNKILLSKDEGIILLVHRYDTEPESGRFYRTYKYVSEIKLTGKVIYSEKENDEQNNIVKTTKDKNARLSFLKARYKKVVGTGTLQFIKYFDLDKNNEPYGIMYFNWNKSINCAKVAKQYKIPVFLLWLLQKGIYPLNELEKEDDSADYELTSNGLTFDFYSMIDTTYSNNENTENEYPIGLRNTKPDSCVIVKLSDYQLEQYHDVFG